MVGYFRNPILVILHGTFSYDFFRHLDTTCARKIAFLNNTNRYNFDLRTMMYGVLSGGCMITFERTYGTNFGVTEMVIPYCMKGSSQNNPCIRV